MDFAGGPTATLALGTEQIVSVTGIATFNSTVIDVRGYPTVQIVMENGANVILIATWQNSPTTPAVAQERYEINSGGAYLRLTPRAPYLIITAVCVAFVAAANIYISRSDSPIAGCGWPKNALNLPVGNLVLDASAYAIAATQTISFPFYFGRCSLFAQGNAGGVGWIAQVQVNSPFNSATWIPVAGVPFLSPGAGGEPVEFFMPARSGRVFLQNLTGVPANLNAALMAGDPLLV